MDILAERPVLSSPHGSDSGLLSVELSLIIECKQSSNPFIFFEAVSPPSLERFPQVLGWDGRGWNSTPHRRPPAGCR